MHEVSEYIDAPDDVKLPNDPVIHRVFLAQIAEAAKIVAAARTTAEDIARECDQLREATYQEGYKAGHDVGIGHGLSDIAKLVERLHSERRDLHASIVDIVEHCSRRLIASTPHRTKISSLVKQAIEEANETGAIAVCVSAASRDRLLSEVGTEAMKIRIAEQDLDVEIDPSLDNDDCLIVYPRHVVDARLEIRLKALISAIRSGWAPENADSSEA